MKFFVQILAVFCFSFLTAKAQYPPQAGILGSTAIHKSDKLIKAWASKCALHKGFMNIADPSLGYPYIGDSTNVLGSADASVVSLGDSGIATIQFDYPLYNGFGPDFVIFENGFANPANAEEAFLELAFVEVSSDGEQFFRFAASSNTPTHSQIKGAGDYMDARLIHNLAGKYISAYGTPFDLEEMKGLVGLDVNNITHIRIIDVVGAINGHSSKDATGQIINDPYPTAFASGGFDLDAVAAINIKSTSITAQNFATVQIYPNPASSILFVTLPNAQLSATKIVLRNSLGQIVLDQEAVQQNQINIQALPIGLYFIGLQKAGETQWIGKCSKI